MNRTEYRKQKVKFTKDTTGEVDRYVNLAYIFSVIGIFTFVGMIISKLILREYVNTELYLNGPSERQLKKTLRNNRITLGLTILFFILFLLFVVSLIVLSVSK